MIPKTGQHPNAPRQRVNNPRKPALAVLVVVLGVLLMLLMLTF